MKKSIKVFLISIFTFLIGITATQAKQLTYDKLQKEIEKINPDAVEARIIGKYIFTDANPLKDQDIMAGALTIDGIVDEDYSEELYNKLTINRLVRKINQQTGEYENWEIVSNLIGGTQITKDTTFDIRWIDKVFIPEETKISVNVDVNDGKYSTYKTVLEEKLGFKADKFYGKYNGEKKLKIDGNKISGLLLKNKDVSLSPEDKKTYANADYFFAYVIEVPNANKDATIKLTNLNGEKTITWDKFDVQDSTDGKTPGIVVLVPVDKTKWEDNKQILIEVDADGEEREYDTLEYTLDISGLEFQEESEMELKTDDLPDADVKSISEKWGYTKSEFDTYELENGEGSNKYKLTDTIVEQKISNGVFPTDEETGFYFLLSVGQNIDPNLYNKATVTYPGNKSTKISTITDETGVTILFSTSDAKKGTPIKITVDLDGGEDKYLPVTYEIDLSTLTLEKSSKFSVTSVDEGGLGKNPLEDAYGWKKGKGFDVDFSTEGNTVKVTGLLSILDEFDNNKHPFEGDDATGYYLPFVIKTLDKSLNGDGKVTVQFIHEGEDPKTLTAANFDDSDELYILRHLDMNASDRTFKIVVDMDGNGIEYAPYEITFDWSELELQYYSAGDNGNYDLIKQDELEEDSQEKEDLEKYGFKSYADSDVKIHMNDSQDDREPYKDGLEGTIREQKLNNGTFKNNDGYFVPIKISFPGEQDELAQDYKNTWTIILNTEDGTTKEYKPTDEEYKQGWVMVLFKIYRDGKNGDSDKKIRYYIDYDGESKDYFLPQEYVIDYSTLTFETENTVKYIYKNEKGEDKEETVTVYESEEVELKDLGFDTKYRKFDGWYKTVDGENQKVEENLTTTKDEDVELTAHFNLNVDEFIKDVVSDLNSIDETYSNDFSGKFNLTQEENTITINLDSPNVPLTELSNTSIPGAIAYLLEKGEIEEITLKVGSQTVTYDSDYTVENEKEYTDESDREILDEKGKALKKEIVKGAKGAFDSDLSNKEANATLDELEFEGKSFTIEIGKTVDTVKLVNSEGEEVTLDDDKKYTFKFDSDFAVVDQDGLIGAKDIETALNDKKDYSTVYIDGKYEAENTINITASNDVTITPVESASSINLLTAENKTISTKTGDYVIDVKEGAGTVTISNLELTGGAKAELKVENGATVKVDNITITGEKDQIDAGIIVSENGKLNASNIVFENETHNTPAIRGIKESQSGAMDQIAKVYANDLTSQYNPIIDVVRHNEPWCPKDASKNGEKITECEEVSYSDEYNTTGGDTFYYVKSENKIDYNIIGFMNNDKISAGMHKVFKDGELEKPIDLLDKDKQVQRDDKDLYFVGWGTVRSRNYIEFSYVVTDWKNVKYSSGDWFHAYYLEKDKTVTVNLTNSQVTDETLKSTNKEFKTYKFSNNNGGMTIGQLKAIDSDFNKLWNEMETKKSPYEQILISIGDTESVLAMDTTVISADAKITVSTLAG